MICTYDLYESVQVPVRTPYRGVQVYGSDVRLTRRAHLEIHRSCQQHTLTGLDANRCALTVRVDPYPLTAIGEVEALRAGRHTYLLDHGELHPRTAWNIPGNPPSATRTVLAEHDCTPMPATWRRPPTERRSTTTTSEEAQF